MVTFNCEVCNDTVPKKNTEKHYYRCPQAYYTCIDCSKTFDDGVSYKQHTQCISEDEKYQKALYKGKKNQKNQNQNQKKDIPTPDATPDVDTKSKKERNKKDTNSSNKDDSKSKNKNKVTKPSPKLESGKSLYKILKIFQKQ
ncbi:uncharacterized protein NDAI_0I00210 [Naumovozyma dairenensis CBS 421]|uniref:C2H2-type domain-containing protein n=1 Tax=Naumovozyma dairenensis (strain ATCC 10597 / BCRC 20456 / CBS 421 / NBRC 0211 / NRRL Y-12639) TaxID=1071378 RepID=G0WFM9_NAUDC|nr:hypothetical protein NDAI_0I00210 [Naumovozyma dairenensis CBS 421]CCD26590.1 hypothetical protein NDAI_0I00210 [Naumovozyma dairenensis CBS 421]